MGGDLSGQASSYALCSGSDHLEVLRGFCAKKSTVCLKTTMAAPEEVITGLLQESIQETRVRSGASASPNSISAPPNEEDIFTFPTIPILFRTRDMSKLIQKLCVFLLCIVMSNTSATFLVLHNGRPGGATQSAAGYKICRPVPARDIYVVSSCVL